MIYRKKAKPRDNGETEYALAGGEITVTHPDGASEVFDLGQLRAIHLSCIPLPEVRDRCEVAFDFGARRLKVDNVHRDGIASFSARYPQFRVFVIAVLGACAPTVEVQVGASRGQYFATVIGVAAVLLGIIYIALFSPVFTAILSGVTAVKFGLVLLMVPGFIIWAKRARPRVLSLQDTLQECKTDR